MTVICKYVIVKHISKREIYFLKYGGFMENKEVKLWGVYNTFKDSEDVYKMDEIDVWNAIDSIGGAIFWARHDAGKPWAADVSMEELIEAQYNLEFLVYSTKRFGVEFSREPSATEHVERSESYNAWFSFWHDHFHGMNPELYNQFVDDKNAGKDVSKYMPTNSWKDSFSKNHK